MGPGPSDVHPRVLGAMAKATIGHLDPEFIGLMEEIKVHHQVGLALVWIGKLNISFQKENVHQKNAKK